MLEIIIVGLVIATDQVTKFVVRTHMQLWESIPWINGVVSFTYVKNSGAGFSFLNGYPEVVEYTALGVVIFLVIFSFAWKMRTRFFELSMGLVIGGALSNMLSRWLSGGSVTDFIHISYWPVFNVADSCVVAGAIGLGIYFMKREEKGGKG